MSKARLFGFVIPVLATMFLAVLLMVFKFSNVPNRHPGEGKYFPGNFSEIGSSRQRIIDGSWGQWREQCAEAIRGQDEGRRLLALSLISRDVDLSSVPALRGLVTENLRKADRAIYTPALEVLSNQPQGSPEFLLAKEAIFEGLTGNDPSVRFLCIRIALKSRNMVSLEEPCKRGIASAIKKYGRDALFPPYAHGSLTADTDHGKRFLVAVLGDEPEHARDRASTAP